MVQTLSARTESTRVDFQAEDEAGVEIAVAVAVVAVAV